GDGALESIRGGGVVGERSDDADDTERAEDAADQGQRGHDPDARRGRLWPEGGDRSPELGGMEPDPVERMRRRPARLVVVGGHDAECTEPRDPIIRASDAPGVYGVRR